MVDSGDKKLLNRLFAREQLKKLEEARINMSHLSHDARIATLNEHARVILEAINPQQFQAYLGWFKQIKSFLRQYKLPALKRALESAQDEVQDLLRGIDKKSKQGGLGGFLKKISGNLGGKDQSAADELKRLNSVNHFLWGVTTFVSRIPIMLDAIDDRLDGKLMGGSTMSEADPAVDAPPAGSPSDTIYDRIIDAGGPKGEKYINDFKKLMLGTMKQSIRGFGVGDIPFLDSKKAAIDILKMRIQDVQSMSKAAQALSDKWDNFKNQVVDDVKAIDTASDKVQNAAGTGTTEQGTEDTGGDPSQKIRDVLGTQDIDTFIGTVEDVANSAGKQAKLDVNMLMQQVASFGNEINGDQLERLSNAVRQLKLEGRIIR